ncbi:MAG: protoheme IX farnesyltransferase [Calditrichaeota bacterium]|nr:MAG: protoheme IX farnesyltransferase [Calditrichota bacterium]MBL1206618.1 protoheme IX farnesyltransferase [Calditrichota bacterium]NOG46445.1 protoheme IX farnesyltransferase [Calditrichota bacterium]
MGKTLKSYFDLTKPTIMLLVVITGGTALVLEGSLINEPFRFLLVIIAIYLTGGSANALNQCFERNIDAKMKRTSAKRPLPTNKISPVAAFVFSISIGVAGLLIFGLFFNWYSALLSLSTILFYSLFYTLYLKPNTSQNIVIGGAAGSMAPVGAWVAASGSMALDPWILFLIIFLWTPPHFWALALVYKDDYRVANLPMMPVVKGDNSTFRQIIVYSWLLVISSLFMLINQSLSIMYILAAVVLGVIFLSKTFKANKQRSEKEIKGLFGYSIIYLFLLFMVIVVDGVI